MTDKDLINEFLKGDNLALKELVDKYTNVLYGFIRRFGFSEDETADLLQDIFIKVWKHAQKFDAEKSSFKTWLFTIARNTIYDALRKKKREVNISSMDDKKSGEFEDESQDVFSILNKIEDKKLLDSLIDKLPTDYKTVVLLHLEEDLTFKEIGEVLDKPLDTVKSQYRRALIKLKKNSEELNHFNK